MQAMFDILLAIALHARAWSGLITSLNGFAFRLVGVVKVWMGQQGP